MTRDKQKNLKSLLTNLLKQLVPIKDHGDGNGDNNGEEKMVTVTVTVIITVKKDGEEDGDKPTPVKPEEYKKNAFLDENISPRDEYIFIKQEKTKMEKWFEVWISEAKEINEEMGFSGRIILIQMQMKQLILKMMKPPTKSNTLKIS